jgi:hypothetical protein
MVVDYIALRHNDLDSDRLPYAFGVRWDPTDDPPECARLGDAEDLTVDTATSPYVSDFDDYMPWMGIKRCVLTERAGDLFAYPGETDELDVISLYDDTSAKVMVEIPKFWVKFDNTNPPYYDYWISPYPLKGYRLHPAFNRYGITVDKIYVGAYEGYVTGSKLYSIANVTPTVSTSRTAFRADAQAWNSSTIAGFGWTMIDYAVWSAIQLLYLVEYASFNSQVPSGSTDIGGLGEGISHASNVIGTGFTGSGTPGGTDLGSASGQVKIDCTHWNPLDVNTDDYAMSYRGIENLWGNTWTLLDGVTVSNTADGGTVGEPCVANYSAVFSDHSSGEIDTYRSGSVMPTASGRIKNPYFGDAFSGICQFAPKTVGGSSTTNMCDYFYYTDYTVARVLGVGGCYTADTNAGIFCLSAQLAVTGTSATAGSRLQYVPYDYMGWTRY